MSTRSVEVSIDDDVLGVRVMVGSCPEDYQLAIDLVTAAARAGDGRSAARGDPTM